MKTKLKKEKIKRKQQKPVHIEDICMAANFEQQYNNNKKIK